jgi:hypothetical protein
MRLVRGGGIIPVTMPDRHCDSLREYVNGAYQAHLQGRAPPSVFAD